jgi:hypothetical protein
MPGQNAADNYLRVRASLPPEVTLLVAAKGRTAAEVAEVVEAGAAVIGHNYVQEAERMTAGLGEAAGRVEWHLIGRLQSNKINRALALFDVVQSVDSERLARAVSERAAAPVRCLVEVNVAGEETKSGCPPEAVRGLVERIAGMPNLRLEGLMTMEPYCEDPDDARPYFRRMRRLFEELKALEGPTAAMDVLSMGMTHSYRVAVEEGATVVRVGTAIFGPRGA